MGLRFGVIRKRTNIYDKKTSKTKIAVEEPNN